MGTNRWHVQSANSELCAEAAGKFGETVARGAGLYLLGITGGILLEVLECVRNV